MSMADFSLVLASALLHAIWNVFAKRSASPLAFFGQLTLAWLVLALPALVLSPLRGMPLQFWWWVAASAASHTLYQVWLSRAYQTADLTIVYPISRSTPALVALVAIPFMDDPVTPVGVLGIAGVMAGVWLVQTQGQLRWRALVQKGTGFAYLTLLATVLYTLADRAGVQLLDRVQPASPLPVALSFFAVMIYATAALLLPYVLRNVSLAAWRATWRGSRRDILLSSVISITSYALILEAMRSASISYITSVRQTSILFAAVLAILMLGERPARARLWGSALIVLGVAAIMLG